MMLPMACELWQLLLPLLKDLIRSYDPGRNNNNFKPYKDCHFPFYGQLRKNLMHFNTVVAERPRGSRVIIIVVKTCHCSVSTCGPFASCLPLFKKRVRQLFDNQQNCFVCLKWAFLFYREWILKDIKGTWLWWCVCTCEKISRGSPSYIKSVLALTCEILIFHHAV